MKQLKQFFAVTLLVATLGISTYAGEMDTPGYVPPPPPPTSAAKSGEMVTPTAASPVPGDVEGATFVTMELESILGVLCLYVY
jgi:hypothetical protein